MAVPDAGEKIYQTLLEILNVSNPGRETNPPIFRIGWPESKGFGGYPMSCYQIEGGPPLEGRSAVQGAKNSVLPILAAALLAPGESVIHNCPDLSDVAATLDILRLLGCRVERQGDTVAVDASALARAVTSPTR